MGNIITNWAKEQKTGKGEVKAVLLCLADSAKDYERGRVEITVPQIAKITEFAPRSIYRWLDILEGKIEISEGVRLNLITRVKSKKADGTNNPNVYQIHCPPEIFAEKPSDCQTPCEPDLVTDSQSQVSDSQKEASETSENSEKPAIQVSDSQLEQGDCQTLSTVLKEEELLKDISLSPRAGAQDESSGFEILETGQRAISATNLFGLSPTDAEQIFTQILVDGLKTRLGTPVVLPDEWKWTKSIEAAWKNSFSAENALEVFDLLEKIRKKKKAPWTVSPELWARKIPKIEELRNELEILEKEGVIEADAANQLYNGNGRGKQNQTTPANGTGQKKRVDLSRFDSPDSG